MQYTWQHTDWPHFHYDVDKCSDLLYQYGLLAGKLTGGMMQLSALPHDDAYLDIMVSEAIKTSEIEGEQLNREDVRSSIKNFMGLNAPHVRVADAKAEGVAGLMMDVRSSFTQPLSKDKLCAWQSMIIVNDDDSIMHKSVARGQWRNNKEPMQIISGPPSTGLAEYEKVHYQAPNSKFVDGEMVRFIDWFNDTDNIPGPLKAAIAHLWFETIHPFEDGNGRVGRAIAELALARDLGHPPLLSLSSEINQHRNDYYNHLNAASIDDLDITDWVVWFCQMVLDAQNSAVEQVSFILSKARFWDRFGDDKLNARQQKVLAKWFAVGVNGFEFGLSAKKYMAMARCSKATATRDLAQLLTLGCVYRLEGGGRNVRYKMNLT